MVECEYDEVGRVARKVIRENQMQDSSINYSADFAYDGMGRMTRERYMKWDSETPASQVMFTLMKDVQREYDLGGNVTKETWRDDRGMLYYEEREYARGYQLTDSTYTNGVLTTSTSGSYTYDTNNNLTETKSLSFTAGGTPYPPGRGNWEFTYDRKNRLMTYTNGTMGNNVMHLRYDGLGRVWQRWTKSGATWSGYFSRFVYDGNQSAQILSYTYDDDPSPVVAFGGIELDLLYGQTGMMRWKIPGEEEDCVAYYLDESGRPGAQVFKGTSTTANRFDRDAQGDTLWKGDWELISIGMQFGQGYGYVERYGIEVFIPEPDFFSDPLVCMGGRHYLPTLRMFTSRQGNGPYSPGGEPGGGGLGVPLGEGNGGIDIRSIEPPRFPRIGRPDGNGGGESWKKYHCTCESCREYLSDTCYLKGEGDLWKAICGCPDGPGMLLCSITYDPCKEEGKSYTCTDLVCGRKTDPSSGQFCRPDPCMQKIQGVPIDPCDLLPDDPLVPEGWEGSWMEEWCPPCFEFNWPSCRDFCRNTNACTNEEANCLIRCEYCPWYHFYRCVTCCGWATKFCQDEWALHPECWGDV